MTNTERNKFAFRILLLAVGLTSLAPIVQGSKSQQVLTITQTILSTEESCVSGFTGAGFTGFISYCGTTVNTAVTLNKSETAWITTSQLVIIIIAVALIAFAIGYIMSKGMKFRKQSAARGLK